MRIDEEFAEWQREWREQDSSFPEVRLPRTRLETAGDLITALGNRSFVRRLVLQVRARLGRTGKKRKGEKNRYA